MRILTFFAHPDDETLASGATLSKLSKDNEILVAIPATGVYARKKNKKELKELRDNCHEALSILGITDIVFGNFSDNEMDRHTLLEITKWLEGIMAKFSPQCVITHHRFCTNIDHQYCHEAAVIACRPSKTSHISMICGEIPSSTGYLRPSQWEPNLYVEVSERNVANKIKAMQTYRNEAREYPHPRSPKALEAMAIVRGSESGYDFAESFMIQKTFQDTERR